MTWIVDHNAVQELAGTLGLEKPVSVMKKTFRQSYIQGAQLSGEDGHVILLNRALDHDMANHTLCHELRHCFQRERLGEDADQAYELYMMLAGYAEHPLELDADEWAAETAPNVRLVRAAT
jgi:Zn-dependent peptidase ImmA (M78 family)